MKKTIIIALGGCVVAASLGYSLGTGWERLRNYDQYVYRFSQYSSYLRVLAEHQQITELTNSIILFDLKFNAHQDPHDLRDAVFQILKVGKYYEDTNAENMAATNGKAK